MNTTSSQLPNVGSPSNILPALDQAPTNGSAVIGPEENSSPPLINMLTQPKSGPKGLKITHTSKSVEKKTLEKTPIADAMHEVENLEKEEAIQRALGHLDEETNFGFKLGGVLARIQKEKWFAPHDTFKKFVEEECGMSYRKAKYLINSYVAVSTSKVDDEKLNDLSWCKLREIAPIITPENVDGWVATASEHTVAELKEIVKAYKKVHAPKAITQQPAKPTRKKTFKFQGDQMNWVDAAIAQAKKASGMQDDETALAHICRGFIGFQAQMMEQTVKS